MALVPTLTITDTTTFSDEINFSVTDELTVTTPSQSLTSVAIAESAYATIFADSGANGSVYIFVKNTNTSGTYQADLRTSAGVVFGTLSPGEFAFFPADTNQGVEAYGVGGGVTIEYAYWTKG
tara:strand:+ start:179 stop:547 length:369 start_codon:yes stop_codon:yes gene_type:complete